MTIERKEYDAVVKALQETEDMDARVVVARTAAKMFKASFPGFNIKQFYSAIYFGEDGNMEQKEVVVVMDEKQIEKIAEGFKARLWDKNHRLQAAHVVATVAYEVVPEFDSYKFFQACGLVDERAA